MSSYGRTNIRPRTAPAPFLRGIELRRLRQSVHLSGQRNAIRRPAKEMRLTTELLAVSPLSFATGKPYLKAPEAFTRRHFSTEAARWSVCAKTSAVKRRRQDHRWRGC